MNKKYLICLIMVALGLIITAFLGVSKYNTYLANKEAKNIAIGDNSNLNDNVIEELNQKEINYDDTIGKLTIPDILLKDAPIKESVELSTLSEAIGHFTNTSIYSGNVGLASHNSGSSGDFFRNLNKIKKGSEIYYETSYGTKRYVVDTIVEIDEEDWSYLEETQDNRITLITCVAGQKEKRLCVQAKESTEGMNYGQ